MKYIDFKRYKFSTITEKLKILGYNFFNFLNPGRYDYRKLYKYLDFRKLYKYLDFRKLYKYIDIKSYDFLGIFKKLNLKRYKLLPLYFFLFLVCIGFIYLLIPEFYSYNKSKLESRICKNQNIKCSIKGKVNYSFYPTPRINIKNLIVNDFFTKKKQFIIVEEASIKISFKNLLKKEKQQFKRIQLNNYQINMDLKDLNKYKNFFSEKIIFMPIIFKNGKIILSNGNDYVSTIHDSKINIELNQKSKNIKLKGKFLNDDIYFKLNSEKKNNKPITDIIFKMSDLNLVTKANFFTSEIEKNTLKGDIIIKKDKQRFSGNFNYKDNEITINKSNLANIFWSGDLQGKIKILPYFDFDLDLILDSINFTKLYSSFLALDEKEQKSLFKVDKKINGKLSVYANKVYSSYDLVKSFESRIKFNNGNISVDQFLISLGKLGAADISGAINSDKKFINFKYESNIFIENQKKFLSKFGVYNKEKIPSHFFISGNLDLQNLKKTFYEISNGEKLKNTDVNFIEQEFNDLMLSDNYENLFRFPKFKEFIKTITDKD